MIDTFLCFVLLVILICTLIYTFYYDAKSILKNFFDKALLGGAASSLNKILIYKYPMYTIARVMSLNWSIINIKNKIFVYLANGIHKNYKCMANFYPVIEITGSVAKSDLILIPVTCFPNIDIFENYLISPILVPFPRNKSKLTIIDLINYLGKLGHFKN